MALTTTKVVDMPGVGTTTGLEDKVLYVTQSPSIDQQITFKEARDYFLNEGVVGGDGILATPSDAMSGGTGKTTLSFKASELTTATPVAADYIVIEDVTDNSSKKVLVSAITGMASGAVTDVASLSSNITASPTTGAVKIDLATTLTGLTSVTSTDFVGALTGNADTATALATARTIGGTSFDGTAAIVPATITVADTTDTTAYVGLWESATGDLEPKTDTGITYNAGTGMLTATGFTGPLTGNADTATALAGTLGVAGGGTGMTSIAKGGVIVSSAADTFSALLGGVGEDGYVLTYNESPDTLTWEPHAGSAGTVSSVASGSGLTGGPITGSGTLSVELTANGGLEPNVAGVNGTLQVAQGISQYDVAQFATGVVDNDFLKIDGTAVEGRSASEVKTDLSLDNVENTALSTWTGSTNVTTLGTIATGTWEGTTVAVDQGGTGQTSYTNGQLLIGNTTGNTLAKATLTAGTNITITEGAGSITIAAAAGGDPAGTAVAMAIALGG